MSPRSKREYLEAIHPRYKKAFRKEKSNILDEFCLNCGYTRKHAIRLLRHFKRYTKPKPKKRGRQTIYNKPEIIRPLKRIWLAANLPCSKILKPLIKLWLPHYHQEFEHLSIEVVQKLLKISPATIDRILKPVRLKYTGRGRSTTKPGTLLRKQIPIKTNQWNESKPGFVESDTVAHCGDSISGIYAHTVDMVDIATGWTEQRAVWGKGETGVLQQLSDIEAKLPFPLLGFDSDNGSEFLNHHLYRHFAGRKNPVQFTRSRPYHKDDNAHIEGKNWTKVRQWLGYQRFDKPGIVPLMNNLYRSNAWRLYHNAFLPAMKLLDKQRIADRIIKRHDTAKTPYQRVLESAHVSQEVKQNLKEQVMGLNPFKLRKEIDAKLKKIFDAVRG